MTNESSLEFDDSTIDTSREFINPLNLENGNHDMLDSGFPDIDVEIKDLPRLTFANELFAAASSLLKSTFEYTTDFKEHPRRTLLINSGVVLPVIISFTMYGAMLVQDIVGQDIVKGSLSDIARKPDEKAPIRAIEMITESMFASPRSANTILEFQNFLELLRRDPNLRLKSFVYEKWETGQPVDERRSAGRDTGDSDEGRIVAYTYDAQDEKTNIGDWEILVALMEESALGYKPINVGEEVIVSITYETLMDDIARQIDIQIVIPTGENPSAPVVINTGSLDLSTFEKNKRHYQFVASLDEYPNIVMDETVVSTFVAGAPTEPSQEEQ